MAAASQERRCLTQGCKCRGSQPGHAFRVLEQPKCIDPKCSSHRQASGFTCIPTREGNFVCDTCGILQGTDNVLELRETFADVENQQERSLEGARSSNAARRRGEVIEDLEARTKFRHASAQYDGLRMAKLKLQSKARDDARSLLPDIAAVKKEQPGVLSREEIKVLKRNWSALKVHVGSEMNKLDSEQARAQMLANNEALLFDTSPLLTASVVSQMRSPQDDGQPSSKRQKLYHPPQVQAELTEFVSRVNARIKSKVAEADRLYAAHDEQVDKARSLDTLDVHTGGAVSPMTVAEIDRSLKQLKHEKMMGQSRDEETDAPVVFDFRTYDSQEAAAQAVARFHAQSLTTASKRDAELESALQSLFHFVMAKFVMPDCLDREVQWAHNPTYMHWFHRALLFLLEYKNILRQESNSLLTNVELFGMQAIVATSWATSFPLTWDICVSVVSSYREHKWELACDALRQRDPEAPLHLIGELDLSVPRVRKQQQVLLGMLERLRVQIDWKEIITALAVFYAKQLLQNAFEPIEEDRLRSAVGEVARQFRSESAEAGIVDHRKALLGLYWSGGQPVSTENAAPAAAAAPAASAAAAAAAAAAPPPPRAVPKQQFLWQFTGAVVAIACVRKLYEKRAFLMQRGMNLEHYQEPNTKISGMVKRKRGSVSSHGARRKLRSSRFASVAGVREEDVARCLRLIHISGCC